MMADTTRMFWKFILYAFCAFFAVFPFWYASTYLYGGTTARSIVVVLFAAGLAIALACWMTQKNARLTLVFSPIFISLFLYLSSLTLSGFTGLSFSTTFWSVATRMTGIWYLLSLGFLMMVLFVVVQAARARHTLILSVTIPAAFYSLLDLFGRDGFKLIFSDFPIEAFTFGNTSFAAMYIFGAFLLALYYLFQAEEKRWWMYVLPVIIIINPNILHPRIWSFDFSSIIGAAQASSFAVFLSVPALFGIWLVSKIQNIRLRSIVSHSLFAVGILSAGIATVSLLSQDGYLREVYLSRSTAVRPLVWAMSERAISERPMLGYGADNFDRVFEKHYDNRLLQGEYGNEAWLDRAHNVFIDQLVDNGIVGTALYFLTYLIIIFCLLYTALHAQEKKNRILASVLIVYFTLHIAELQTAFDTSISYPMLALMTVLAAAAFYEAVRGTKWDFSINLTRPAMYIFAAVIFLASGWSVLAGAVPLMNTLSVNSTIRQIGISEKRIPLYPGLFSSPVDAHAFLWRISTDFQRGIAQDPTVLESPKKVEGLKKEIVIFESAYRAYIAKNPDHFRSYLNLADVLMYQNLFGVNKLAEAQSVLDQAIALVPASPQPYWMKAVGYLYMGKFALAREYAKKGLELNPKIKQSQELVAYIERSVKTFPEIDLFFFRQI